MTSCHWYRLGLFQSEPTYRHEERCIIMRFSGWQHSKSVIRVLVAVEQTPQCAWDIFKGKPSLHIYLDLSKPTSVNPSQKLCSIWMVWQFLNNSMAFMSSATISDPVTMPSPIDLCWSTSFSTPSRHNSQVWLWQCDWLGQESKGWLPHMIDWIWRDLKFLVPHWDGNASHISWRVSNCCQIEEEVIAIEWFSLCGDGMEMVTALRGAHCTWYGIIHGGDFSLVRVEHTISVLW